MKANHINTEVITITPKMASNWLASYNNHNRSLRDGAVAKYAEDMANGMWRFTHQGIAFYATGELADGQHRLAAIVKAGVAVPMLVTRNLPVATAVVIDQNAPRKAHDAIRLGGGLDWIDRSAVAIARCALSELGIETNPRSISTVTDYAERHKELILKAMSFTSTKKRNLTNAGIVTSYFCALYAGEPEEKIYRFAQIMLNGEIVSPQENAAIKMREYLLTNGPGVWVGWSRVETMYRLQRAIQLFCEGKHISKLVTVDHFIYPAPK